MTTLLDPLDLEPGKAVVDEVPLWIGGTATTSAAGRVEDDISPSTGELLAKVHVAARADIDRAVAAAKAAQPAWARLTLVERGARLKELARRIRAKAEEFGRLDARDGGTAFQSMQAGAHKGAAYLELIAGVGPELHGRTIPATSGLHFTEPAPWGIVGAICRVQPPDALHVHEDGAGADGRQRADPQAGRADPALPAGGGRAQRRSPPPGDLQRGRRRRETGEAIVTHPDILRISFTGSLPTGRRVYAGASQSGQFKSVTLELGGKNPIVIYPDVDPAIAAAAIIKGTNFARVGGQSCGATSRLLLHEALHDEVLERVVADTVAIKLGIPDDPATEMGCMVSHAHRDRVLSMIGDAREDGARLLAGAADPSTDRISTPERSSSRPSSMASTPRRGCSGTKCSVPCSASRRGRTSKRRCAWPTTPSTG